MGSLSLIEDCWEKKTLLLCSLSFSPLISLSPPFNFLSTKLIFSISQRLRKYKEVERNDAMRSRKQFFEIFFFVCEKNVNDQSLLVRADSN